MENGWTPGPWYVVNHADGEWTIQDRPRGAGTAIARQYGCDFKQSRANAALMALAPEMATLLQRIAASDPGHSQFATLVMGEVREILERLPNNARPE